MEGPCAGQIGRGTPRTEIQERETSKDSRRSPGFLPANLLPALAWCFLPAWPLNPTEGLPPRPSDFEHPRHRHSKIFQIPLTLSKGIGPT
jgi:hypothetical protein